MLEFLLCSLFTILPDYFFRRYAQGKHWGQEIDFFTVWYELRWGITACALLTVALIECSLVRPIKAYSLLLQSAVRLLHPHCNSIGN